MKIFIVLAAFVAFASSKALNAENPAIGELEGFYMKSVVEADFSFRKFFTVKKAFIDDIVRNLDNSYQNFQISLARFPVSQLSAETRKSFDELTNSIDYWLGRSSRMSETALNQIWNAHPNTGIRGPKTPSEIHLDYTMRIRINFLQESIRDSDDKCLAPFVPSFIPSYQPFADAIVNAAIDQIPTINEQTFKMSLQSKAESLEATDKIIGVLDFCGSTTTGSAESCIQDFLAANVNCDSCRFVDPFSGPSAFIAMDAAGVANAYETAKQRASIILMENPTQRDIAHCRIE